MLKVEPQDKLIEVSERSGNLVIHSTSSIKFINGSSALHVCIVTGEFPALSETFITTKALELCRRGHKVTVVKNQHHGHINQSHLEEVKKEGIEVLSLVDSSSTVALLKIVLRHPFLLLRSLSLDLNAFKRKLKSQLQLRLLKKHRYDVIHFEFSGLAVAYSGVFHELKNRIVVSCRGTAEKVKMLTQPGRAEKLSEVFRAVDAVHCVSEDMASTIAPYCSREKIFVNRPSVDAKVFQRAKPYTPGVKFNILSIGRFTFQKGYLLGLLAIKELSLKGANFNWTIVGDGPQLEELQYHIDAMKLGGCVKLPGKKSRDEIVSLYNDADIFFLPSVYEGIANVCLEAMSMELPVVATKSGGMEEVIEHGLNGMLAEVYDHQQMAEHLYALYNDFDMRRTTGVNARKRILRSFTIQQQAEVFEEQYRNLINAYTKVQPNL